jgi:quercetin 2,3-dioxygenase
MAQSSSLLRAPAPTPSVRIFPFAELGRFENDWLSARYHFSFANWHDPRRMGLGPLRVWNDDRVRPGGGFGMHPHRDMEIITYVREGALTHEDSLGNKGRIGAGEVQVMSAGSGIVHAEQNDGDEDVTLFQIWIHPRRTGAKPRWEQATVPREPGALKTLVSGHGEVLTIDQDAALLAGVLPAGRTVTHALGRDRRAYIVPARGAIEVNGQVARTRDGVAVEGVDTLTITALDEAEVVLLDLP